MTILDKIIAHKYHEVAADKVQKPIQSLEKSPFFNRPVYSLKQALQNDNVGIIAEYKRKSPSKGLINDRFSAEEIATGYSAAGAAALSVLTDVDFFGGDKTYLSAVRLCTTLPILRKDFIIDEYQIIEAKALGADAILLIAAALDQQQVLTLAKVAKSLSLEVLFEIHEASELSLLNDYIDVVGVNNRNLKTFTVSIEQSISLLPLIPKQFAKISESGISKANSVQQLQRVGFDGFLIGEAFMKTADPAASCKQFIQEVLGK